MGRSCPVGQRARIQLMVHISFSINILYFRKGFKDLGKEILVKCHLIMIWNTSCVVGAVLGAVLRAGYILVWEIEPRQRGA